MLDFTSSLYLGLHHPMQSLRPWQQFTTGKPAVLGQPQIASIVEKQLATLQGFQRAVLGSSTFHLFWDLFGILAKKEIVIYLDDGAYPISKWGVDRAAAASILVKKFKHHNVKQLNKLILNAKTFKKRPVIVTDGFCPLCGKAAPLDDYVSILKQYGGYLIIDDTQALGILGRNPVRHMPYGIGGGGSLRWHDLEDSLTVSVSSMAKGFGVPLAVLSGSDKFVRQFEAASDTRVHASPPSIADIYAAEHAISINQLKGDALREKLVHNVVRFRNRLCDAGIFYKGGIFPVQAISVADNSAVQIHKQLYRYGVKSVLQQSCMNQMPCISFIITARHNSVQLDEAANAFIEIYYEFLAGSLRQRKSYIHLNRIA